MARDRSQPRSLPPGPAEEAENVFSAKTAAQGTRTTKRSRAAVVLELISVYVAHLGDKDRTAFTEMCSVETARRLGLTRNPQDVFDAYVEGYEVFASCVQAG